MLSTETHLLFKAPILILVTKMFEQIALISAQYLAAFFILMMLGIMTFGAIWAKTTVASK